MVRHSKSAFALLGRRHLHLLWLMVAVLALPLSIYAWRTVSHRSAMNAQLRQLEFKLVPLNESVDQRLAGWSAVMSRRIPSFESMKLMQAHPQAWSVRQLSYERKLMSRADADRLFDRLYAEDSGPALPSIILVRSTKADESVFGRYQGDDREDAIELSVNAETFVRAAP